MRRHGPSMDNPWRSDWASLMETIRTWDWRAAPVQAGPPPADETASTVSALTATAPAEHREQPSVVQGERSVVSEQPGVVLSNPPWLLTNLSWFVTNPPWFLSNPPWFVRTRSH